MGMAAKISAQDITDAGFRPAQFGMSASGGAASWTAGEPAAYLGRLLLHVEAWSRGRFGDGYDAASGMSAERLHAAELCYASAKLWKRRAAFIDSNAVSSLESPAYLDRREFEAQAARAMECAEENMALATGGETNYSGTGAALVGVETGPYVTPSIAGLP